MKQLLLVLMITAFIASFVGCDRAQQALDTIEKAKSLKGDIEKKAQEVKEKAQDFIPGKGGKNESDKEKGGQGKDRKEGGKESGKEKDD